MSLLGEADEPRAIATTIVESDAARVATERGYQVVVLVMKVGESDCGIVAAPVRGPGFIAAMLASASRYLFAADACECPACKKRKAAEASVRH